MLALLDEDERLVYRKRLGNDAPSILEALAPYREVIVGLVVESTYNGYWLVDAPMEAGYRVHLANTAALVPYSGLKYSDDDSDARWLAEPPRVSIDVASHKELLCEHWGHHLRLREAVLGPGPREGARRVTGR